MKRLTILTVILFTSICSVECSTISQKNCQKYAGLIRNNKQIEDLLNAWFKLPGKVPTVKGEFPHMVKIGYEHDENDTRRITWGCGGTLISDQFVLTAASCRTFGSTLVYGDKVFILFKRRRSLRNMQPRAPLPDILELPADDSPIKFIKIGDQTIDEQIIEVEEIILHPNMTPPSFYHDIAILKLSKKINFTENVHPACLFDGKEDLTNKSLIATGWGVLGIGHYFNDDLMKLNMTVFPQDTCHQTFDNNIVETYLSNGVDDKTQMCVGSGNKEKNKNLCPGDGGGPFQKKNEKYSNIYDIVGIISFGYYCNIVNLPILTTRIQPYVPWIESIVWSK